ncbi:MAG TPA: TlpA disulfide reductase family protein [Spirochaetota bacterium]|nr:MAG: Thiol-disulfide oxidoreductase ResA [Spirochaetes bacterium ADurb.Bin133]HNZ27215.1 TlpA disulfide reductase family protein [Spirochaetota bacterium]HPY88901.1 TlpA disulfide reductase family protein [Spirochaetota bacterium]
MKKIKFYNIIFYIILVILIFLFIKNKIPRYISDSKLKDSPEINFSFEDIKGVVYDSEEYKDKNVLLVFWASWRAPCKMEAPIINSIYKDYKDQITVVSINSLEKRDVVIKAINELNITYPVVLDEKGKISSKFEVNSLPTIYFIKNNKVAKVSRGFSIFLKSEVKKIYGLK